MFSLRLFALVLHKKRKLNRFSWLLILLFFHLPSSFIPANIENVYQVQRKTLPNPNDYSGTNIIGKDFIDIIMSTNFFFLITTGRSRPSRSPRISRHISKSRWSYIIFAGKEFCLHNKPTARYPEGLGSIP